MHYWDYTRLHSDFSNQISWVSCLGATVYPAKAWSMMTSSNISALLAICAGNSPVTGEFPAQRPVTRSFDVFFDLRLNGRLTKQSWGWWFETPPRPLWRHSNAFALLFGSGKCILWFKNDSNESVRSWIMHMIRGLSGFPWLAAGLFYLYISGIQEYMIGDCQIVLKQALLWRHNERNGVSNHQPQPCLLNRLFRRRSNKISKLRITGLCEGNSPVTGEVPAQMTSNEEMLPIWWRHHEI